ncbi:MAG: acyltransferase [Kiritimatiellae bacterium]|nr:acyltransferase [Kiritimatiellia bacterium]
MLKIDDGLSGKLANMGLLCAFLVVFIHTPADESCRGAWLIRGYFSHGLAKIAVPYFFTAAGFLLAGRFDQPGWYSSALRKRAMSLLVPLVFWCAVHYFFRNVFLPVLGNLLYGRSVFSGMFPAGFRSEDLRLVFALEPYRQPYLAVLWFLRTLFVLVAASPLLRRLAKPWFIIPVWLANGWIFPDYGVECTEFTFMFQEGFLSLFGTAYFCLGMYLRSRSAAFGVKKAYALIALAMGAFILSVRGGDPYVDVASRTLTWLSIPFLLCGVWSLMPSKPLPRALTSLAFPVYILHTGVIEILGLVGERAGMLSVFTGTTAGYCAFGVVIASLAALVAFGLRRFLPNAARVVFGGR